MMSVRLSVKSITNLCEIDVFNYLQDFLRKYLITTITCIGVYKLELVHADQALVYLLERSLSYGKYKSLLSFKRKGRKIVLFTFVYSILINFLLFLGLCACGGSF